MDNLLYISMIGAEHTMLAQAINANNLANVSTLGFKEDLVAMQGIPIAGDGYPTRVQVSIESTGVNLSAGAITTTGRELDIAVGGNGWIAVQDKSGNEAYTRAGNLQITQTGELITSTGLRVIGNSGGPVAIPPAEKVEIGVDGTISIRPIGQTPAALVTADRIKLVNPDIKNLVKGLDGLMRLNDQSIAVADASVRVISGALEMSNVNAVDAMVNMIALSRQFEAQIKMMKEAEEIDQASTQLMSIS